MRRAIVTFSAFALGVALVGCGQTATPPDTGGSTVAVALQEWAVVPEVTSSAPGPVRFRVTNEGPEDVHEFVILRTATGAGDLPTDPSGAVSEAGEGLEVVDEVEDLAVGASADVFVQLDAGHYVLLCNIYDAGEDEAHYQMGMRTDFTVGS